jgi:hypothetical protein
MGLSQIIPSLRGRCATVNRSLAGRVPCVAETSRATEANLRAEAKTIANSIDSTLPRTVVRRCQSIGLDFFATDEIILACFCDPAFTPPSPRF